MPLPISTGVRFGEALDGIGWRGEVKAGRWHAVGLLELHIEQGPILEAEDKTIGVVTGVQGVRWYEATITGRESHAGTTPMPRAGRRCVAACARLALEVQEIALAHAPTAVGTVGRVEVEPNSPNVIPGVVRMTVDLRHHDEPCCEAWKPRSAPRSTRIAARRQVQIATKKLHDIAAVAIPPRLRRGGARAAPEPGPRPPRHHLGRRPRRLHMSRITPTAMIFVPCKDGLSHNEAESATLEHCAAGAQVLLEAALALDAKLGGR